MFFFSAPHFSSSHSEARSFGRLRCSAVFCCIMSIMFGDKGCDAGEEEEYRSNAPYGAS